MYVLITYSSWDLQLVDESLNGQAVWRRLSDQLQNDLQKREENASGNIFTGVKGKRPHEMWLLVRVMSFYLLKVKLPTKR